MAIYFLCYIRQMKKDSKIKLKWDLENLLYKSPQDPNIEKDVQKIELAYSSFAKKYSNKNFLESAEKLKTALDDYEKLCSLKSPFVYLKLFSDFGNKEDVMALQNRYSQRLTKSSNLILFFDLSLGGLTKEKQKNFLLNPLLKKYQYFLKQIFNQSKYNLSEPEEKILKLSSLTSSVLWVRNQNKLQLKQSIKFKNKEISIGEASNLLRSSNKKNREVLGKLINQKLKDISFFAECEMNAIILNKKMRDELRGYKKPYSATILGYQNDEKVIENLVDIVTKNYKISHRFYKIKAKLLKEKYLNYWDRSASIGTNTKKIPFEKGLSVLQNAFSKLGPRYLNYLNTYMENGQVDVFPRLLKASGAYCWSNTNMPTFVLLNYTNDLDSIMTFGHEMGHAIHGELSKSQPVIYEGHTTSVAEVASTLFENFVFEDIFQTLNEKEKIIALHNRIEDDVVTIFRQIACFNFETELHNTIREKGNLEANEIGLMLNKHMKNYIGPVVKMTEDDGYHFVYWSHIRRFFYVYSYAYGQIISKALYKNYQKDKKFLTKIEQFLSAGESMAPEDIFKSIGIDTKNPKFFLDGLMQIEKDIDTLEKLIKKHNFK